VRIVILQDLVVAQLVSSYPLLQFAELLLEFVMWLTTVLATMQLAQLMSNKTLLMYVEHLLMQHATQLKNVMDLPTLAQLMYMLLMEPAVFHPIHAMELQLAWEECAQEQMSTVWEYVEMGLKLSKNSAMTEILSMEIAARPIAC
jgi:hypothetical protein